MEGENGNGNGDIPRPEDGIHTLMITSESSNLQCSDLEISATSIESESSLSTTDDALDKTKASLQDLSADIPEKYDCRLKFQDLKEKSFLGSMTSLDYHKQWMKLISKVPLTPEWEDFICDVYCVAIEKYPVPAGGENNLWTVILSALCVAVMDKGLSYVKVQRAFDSAEWKFSNSYICAGEFWRIIRSFEMKMHEKLPKDQFTRHMINFYKKGFSKPYFEMHDDFDLFSKWVQQENLAKSISVEVQEIYLQTAEQLDRVEKCYPQWAGKTELHHVAFQEWITFLLKKDPPLIATVEVLCEEYIAQEPDHVCYYLVYLNALESEAFNDYHLKKEKMVSVIKRGLRMGVRSCVSTLVPLFIEHSMMAAIVHLTPDDVNDLIDNELIEKFNIKLVPEWYASRCAILNGTQFLIQEDIMPNEDLETMFYKMILPVDREFLTSVTVLPDFWGIKGLDCAVALLAKYCITLLTKHDSFSWERTLIHWEDMMGNTHRPELVIVYSEFIRDHSDYDETAQVYKVAITKLENICDSPSGNQTARHALLYMVSNFLELAKSKGPFSDQIWLSNELTQKIAAFTLKFKEESYDMKISPYDLSVLSIPTLESDSTAILSSDPRSSLESATMSSHSSEKQLAHRTQGSVEMPDTLPNKIWPVFISNLNFSATESDIIAAFKDQQIHVAKVSMKMKPNGCNFGYATIYLDSQMAVEYALQCLDRIIIKGRQTFLSPHRQQEIADRDLAHQSPKPTVLFLEGLTPDMEQRDKLESVFSCFGHVKAVHVDDKKEPKSANVEFVFSSDAENAYKRWKEGAINAIKGLNIRLGFAAKRKRSPSCNKEETGASQSSAKRPTRREYHPMSSSSDWQNPRMKFIPIQARLQKPLPAESTSTGSGEKRQLTNEDFKRLVQQKSETHLLQEQQTEEYSEESDDMW